MSDLQPESLETFERLLTEQNSYLTEVDQQIIRWRQFRDDYQHLRSRLETLPDRLTYDCMVPFGKLAFLPGRIVHSNELLVLLGENFFVERSCKQALTITDRRLANIDKKLEDFKAEQQLFQQQQKYTDQLADDKRNFVEIKENQDQEILSAKKSSRRAVLTDEQIREERRRLQERAAKMTAPVERPKKVVHFEDEQMEVGSDDDEESQLQKIFIRHTKIDVSPPTDDSSPALFDNPGAIGRAKSIVKQSEPPAFTGKTVERQIATSIDATGEPPAKRISKFKASRS